MLSKPDTPAPPPAQCGGCGSSKIYVWSFSQTAWVLPNGCETCRKRQETEQQAQDRHIQARVLLRACKVPEACQKLTLDSLIRQHNKLAIARLIGLRAKRGECIHLVGKTGRGKTTSAMVTLCEKIRETGLSGMFVTEFQIAENLIPDLEQVMNTRILVLDDLGKNELNRWAINKLCGIIDHRERERLSTIVTSEYTPQELLEQMDNRIAFRWFRMVRGESVLFEGPNYRELLEDAW